MSETSGTLIVASSEIKQSLTAILYPKNQLSRDITSDGYADCGSVKFTDFRVWYLKEQNNV
jgi:hypothetical protein